MRPFLPTATALFLAPLLAGAQDRPELVIYTYESFVSEWGPGPAIAANFEAVCDCDVRFVGAGDGASLLSRLRLEGARSPADIVLGLDTNLTAEATDTGLFQPHGIETPDLTLPVEWSDPVFLPYDWGYFAFVHGEDLADVPANFEELAASETTIVIHDPRSSTPGLGLLMWVKAAYGDRAPEIWAGLADNIVTVTPGWSEAYGLFLAGEVDMALAYTTSPAYHLIAEDDPTKSAAMFDEGHYMQIEVAGDDRLDRPAGPRAAIPRLHAHRRVPGRDPHDQLDVPGAHPWRRPARGLRGARGAGNAAPLQPRGGARRARRRAGRMAARAQPLGAPALLGGGLALALVAALTLGSVAALALRADPGRGLGAADWSAIRFTLTQALISAGLSVALAIPAARALARRRFPGRTALVTLLGAPFLLPAIVAVFGLVAIWGRSGLFSDALGLAGRGPLDIYGLTGVVLAHVFFNLPLVTRLILQGWTTIPAEQFRLAAQLGFAPGDTFRQIELPMLRGIVPGAFVLVFLLCMTSFAVALTLGGGPRATTIELAIYQAVRFDFDLSRAALLALIQFALCAAITALALRMSAEAVFGGGAGAPVERWDAARRGLRATDAIILVALALFTGLPLGAVVLNGAAAMLAGLPDAFWPAAARSLGVALASAALAIALGLALAALVDGLRARGRGRVTEGFGLMTLAASPFVLGTGSSSSSIRSRTPSPSRSRSRRPSTPRWRCPSCCARSCRRWATRAASTAASPTASAWRVSPASASSPGRACVARWASPPVWPPRSRWAISASSRSSRRPRSRPSRS